MMLLVAAALVIAMAIFRVLYAADAESDEVVKGAAVGNAAVENVEAETVAAKGSVSEGSAAEGAAVGKSGATMHASSQSTRTCRHAWKEIYRARVTLSTFGKIFIGYFQVTAAFQTFQYVRWPPLFKGLLQKLEVPLEFLANFEMMPLDCIVSARVPE